MEKYTRRNEKKMIMRRKWRRIIKRKNIEETKKKRDGRDDKIWKSAWKEEKKKSN